MAERVIKPKVKTGNNTTDDIKIPYNILSNPPDLSVYAKKADLATVATSGSYNDLLNKPAIPDVSGKANLSGGNTFTGKQTLNSPASDGYSINAAGYIKGSWLQASTVSNKGANTGKVCVFDNSGWIYYRTPAEILTEAGGAKASDIPTKTSQLTNDSGYTTNKGTVTQVKINGTTKSPDSAGLVDLGTVGGGGSTDAVKYTPQTLTTSQKSQARSNIGAGTGNGTVTGVKINGSTKGTSGVVDLGYIQVKVNGTTYTADNSGLIDLGEISGGTSAASAYNDIY